MVTKNRFEQVDEPQPDAITLTLAKGEAKLYGTVTCPANLSAGRLLADVVSSRMEPKESFRAAIRLANEIRAPVVVIDPEGLWQPEWGSLFREAS